MNDTKFKNSGTLEKYPIFSSLDRKHTDFQQNPEITRDNIIQPFTKDIVKSNDKIYTLLKLNSTMSFISQTDTP